MARISGVDIPKQKRGVIALTYIFGIGRSRAQSILEIAKVDENKKVSEWTDDETGRIREAVGSFKIEGELRSEVQLNIKRLMDIGCYRGIRHRVGLPLRGQRTKNNSRTRKGKRKTVANKKKRKVIVESIGEAHVTASFNNIIISLTNTKGEVISWSSAGKMGFRGSKKNTPYAAQTAAEDCAKVAQEAGLRKVKVFVKGPGNGRESAIRSLHNAGIEVMEIIDITPQPHNGCRPPKRRRV
jgi:small subunit ribosomal protein S11